MTLFAQITISAEQVRMIRDWAEPAAVPIIIWLWKRSVKATRTAFNQMITDNVNRGRDELQAHVDKKFLDHEDSAFARIADLEKSNTALARSVNELRTIVLKYQGEMDELKGKLPCQH